MNIPKVSQIVVNVVAVVVIVSVFLITGCATQTTGLRPAADRGDALAQFNLGTCYLNGDGVPKDDVEAAKWFQRAADRGYAKAEAVLGGLYELGQGVTRDYVTAAQWYREAAEQGYAGAQWRLGFCYWNGQGLPQDYVEAYKWYSLAATQGQKDAVNSRDQLSQVMTHEQVVEGQQRASRFVARSTFVNSPTGGGSTYSTETQHPTGDALVNGTRSGSVLGLFGALMGGRRQDSNQSQAQQPAGASFLGILVNSEMITTISGQMAWRCTYNINGTVRTIISTEMCPTSMQFQ